MISTDSLDQASIKALETVDWEDVLETLDDQKCILFIGTGAYEAPGGGNMENALTDWLDASNPDHPHIHLHNPDGFYLFKKNRYKRKIITEMKRFFNQPFPETEMQFSRIARTPFSMLFSLTPDNILARTFDVMGYEYEPDFYFRNRKASNKFVPPTKHKPLIYNLMGNIEEPESLVLTHSDFFDYLQSVFLAKSMNEDLLDALERMDRYIFLGLPYEKWYFQLLLRVLSLHSEKMREIERLALEEFEDPRLHKIYTEEFKIEFFPASTSAFIGELYRKCEAEDLLKPLPKIDPEEANLPDPALPSLKELLAEAKTADVMQQLKVYLQRRKPRSSSLLNDLIVLRNQFNLLVQRELRGTIDSRDLSVENNQIVERMLELIASAEHL
ncbi:MAG: SIR2 family protein [Bacteroidota bacterium]